MSMIAVLLECFKRLGIRNFTNVRVTSDLRTFIMIVVLRHYERLVYMHKPYVANTIEQRHRHVYWIHHPPGIHGNTLAAALNQRILLSLNHHLDPLFFRVSDILTMEVKDDARSVTI